MEPVCSDFPDCSRGATPKVQPLSLEYLRGEILRIDAIVHTVPTIEALEKLAKRIRDLPLKCQGQCELRGGHSGPVLSTQITAPDGRDWGLFDYCDTARQTDRESKFTVDIRT